MERKPSHKRKNKTETTGRSTGNKRPRSAKPSRSSDLTSYFKTFVPQLKNISEVDREEIMKHLQSKISSISHLMHNQPKKASQATQERLREINLQKERRREEFMQKRMQEEIERKKLANKLRKENKELILQREIAKHQKKAKIEESHRRAAAEKEKKKTQDKEKRDLLDNINAYYTSKADELKGQIEEQKKIAKLIDKDKKKAITTARVNKKTKQTGRLQDVQSQLDNYSSQMQMKMLEGAEYIKKNLTEY